MKSPPTCRPRTSAAVVHLSQIVAVVAVCALAYGAYRYAPFGPSEVRLALAVLLGLVGIPALAGYPMHH